MSNKLRKDHLNLSKYTRDELEDEFIKLYTRCLQAEAKADRYEENFKVSQQERFGRSSEKNIAGQMSLSDFDEFNIFNEAEACANEGNEEPNLDETIAKNKVDEQKKKKRKGKPSRKDLSGLEVKEVEFTLSEDEMVCPECGGPLHFVKKTTHVEIVVEEPKVYVKKYVTSHYACRNCEKNDKGTFVTAPGAPKELFRNSPASPSVVASIIAKKYNLALPFDRIANDFKQKDIPVSKGNMCKWSIMASDKYLSPIVDVCEDTLMKEDAIHCDETFTRVVNQDDKESDTKPYIWVKTTAEYQKDHPIAIYSYQPGRSDIDCRNALGDYSGYVMCDAYTCYESVLHKNKETGAPPLKIKPVACMVHVKRGFVKALANVNKKDWPKTSAYLAAAKIEKIFEIDNKIQYSTYEERKEKRIKDLKPAMVDFFAWCKKEKEEALPKSKYGEAINYAINQEEKAMRLFEDGRLELDNNMAERTVKPFVIGRKNWMFHDTVCGAKASCVMYSLVQMAKMNNLNVEEYINYILEECRGKNKLTKTEAKKFLPWSKDLPEYLKNPAKA